MVVLVLIFRGISVPFSMIAPVYIPTNGAPHPLCLASLPTLVTPCLFGDSHFSSSKGKSRGLDGYFPDDQCCESFHVLAGYFYVLFGKISIHISCSFKNKIVVFLLLSCMILHIF